MTAAPLAIALFLAQFEAAELAACESAKIVKRPSADDLQQVMPAAAVEKGTDGSAQITCQVTAEGLLKACRIDQESPAGVGFGQAAIALARFYVLSPADPKCPSRERSYTFKTNWKDMINFRNRSDRRKLVPVSIWAEAPSRAEVAAERPRAGAGATMLRCRVARDGRLRDCETLQETARGMGAAAKRLSGKFRAPPFPEEAYRGGAEFYTDVPFAFEPDEAKPQLKASRVRTADGWTGEPPSFPAAARATGVSTAKVTLSCSVGRNGALSGCSVASEQPAGLGFGEAALETAQGLALTAWTDEGRPVDGATVTLPISFRDEAAAPQAATAPSND